MSSVTKLKDEARRFEQQEDWDRAIQHYLRVLRGAEGGAAEIELPLYNRVGDLYLRLGRAPDAVTYYEQAADRYAEAGLYNNAIALCNKALRYAPGRLPLVRKLGRFCALQGFVTDARRWFLTYSERMFAQGAVDDALGALEDFANISEDPEIRELLARHLHTHGQPDQALIEYRRAYGIRIAAGDASGADALRAQVLRLYPDETDLTPEPLKQVFEEHKERAEPEGDQLPGLSDPARVADAPEPAAERARPAPERAAPAVDALPGLESTHAAVPAEPLGAAPLPGFESTALAGGAADSVDEAAPLRSDHGGEAEEPEPDDAGEDLTPLPLLDPPPAASMNGHAGDDVFNVGAIEIRPEVEADDLPPMMAGAAASDYVDLYSFIDPDEGRLTDTRFVIEETEPTGDEDRDFAELLAQFKAKLNEAVDPEDAASHYDLGLAFKEMGLVDEAIAEFQRAMRAGEKRLKVLEELGQCFIAKGHHNIAARVLQTAVGMKHDDDMELIGVFYHLGRAYEALGKTAEARDAYEHVLGLDINFQDVTERIVRL
jgi:tetratricopeptide (TPR) repeat protein